MGQNWVKIGILLLLSLTQSSRRYMWLRLLEKAVTTKMCSKPERSNRDEENIFQSLFNRSNSPFIKTNLISLKHFFRISESAVFVRFLFAQIRERPPNRSFDCSRSRERNAGAFSDLRLVVEPNSAKHNNKRD